MNILNKMFKYQMLSNMNVRLRSPRQTCHQFCILDSWRESESSLVLGRTLHIEFLLLLCGSISSVSLHVNEAVYISGPVLFCSGLMSKGWFYFSVSGVVRPEAFHWRNSGGTCSFLLLIEMVCLQNTCIVQVLSSNVVLNTCCCAMLILSSYFFYLMLLFILFSIQFLFNF